MTSPWVQRTVVVPADLGHQGAQVGDGRALGQGGVDLDPQPSLAGQGHDGLQAPHVPAGDDAAHRRTRPAASTSPAAWRRPFLLSGRRSSGPSHFSRSPAWP